MCCGVAHSERAVFLCAFFILILKAFLLEFQTIPLDKLSPAWYATSAAFLNAACFMSLDLNSNKRGQA